MNNKIPEVGQVYKIKPYYLGGNVKVEEIIDGKIMFFSNGNPCWMTPQEFFNYYEELPSNKPSYKIRSFADFPQGRKCFECGRFFSIEAHEKHFCGDSLPLSKMETTENWIPKPEFQDKNRPGIMPVEKALEELKEEIEEIADFGDLSGETGRDQVLLMRPMLKGLKEKAQNLVKALEAQPKKETCEMANCFNYAIKDSQFCPFCEEKVEKATAYLKSSDKNHERLMVAIKELDGKKQVEEECESECAAEAWNTTEIKCEEDKPKFFTNPAHGIADDFSQVEEENCAVCNHKKIDRPLTATEFEDHAKHFKSAFYKGEYKPKSIWKDVRRRLEKENLKPARQGFSSTEIREITKGFKN